MPAVPWTDRVWGEFHADNLTRAYRDVLLTLRTFRGTGGVCTPAHATLADRAGCSVRTVQRALRMAERLGLVSWCERRVRAGWRWLRTSNAYRLEHPDGEVRPGLRPAWPARRATSGQDGRGGESINKKRMLTEMLLEAARLPDLLARRRAAFERQMLDKVMARAVR
jgi:AraC-like DNA-binding protein